MTAFSHATKKSYKERHSLTETELLKHLTKTALLSSLIQAAGEMREGGGECFRWSRRRCLIYVYMATLHTLPYVLCLHVCLCQWICIYI